MCGLVSVITKNKYGFTSEQKDIFSILLYLDVLRGEDSTGVFVVNNLGNVELAKDALPSADFIRTPEFKKLRDGAFSKGWAMVGHNRKATMGTITDSNAHPFAVDEKIVLVHNGTLVGGHKHHADTDVDSEAIAHLLAKEADPEAVLRKVNGAFALIWYNIDERKLHFVRNNQRPLFFLETSNEFIFASEECFLTFVIGKFNLKPLKNGGPYSLKQDHLFSFELTENKDTKLHNRDMDISYHKHNVTTGSSGGASVQGPFPWPPKGCGADTDDAVTDEWYSEWYRQRGSAPFTPPIMGPHRALSYSRPIDTTDMDNTKAFLNSISMDCATINYKEYLNICKLYTAGEKIKTIVNDLTEAENDPKTTNYLFIGKPIGMRHIYSVFHKKEDNWNEAYRMANDGVFQMEVKRVSWHRTEPVDTKKPMDEWLGICCIHGVNPEFIDVEAIPQSANDSSNVIQMH